MVRFFNEHGDEYSIKDGELVLAMLFAERIEVDRDRVTVAITPLHEDATNDFTLFSVRLDGNALRKQHADSFIAMMAEMGHHLQHTVQA